MNGTCQPLCKRVAFSLCAVSVCVTNVRGITGASSRDGGGWAVVVGVPLQTHRMYLHIIGVGKHRTRVFIAHAAQTVQYRHDAMKRPAHATGHLARGWHAHSHDKMAWERIIIKMSPKR